MRVPRIESRPSGIVALRQNLAEKEAALREQADREARLLVAEERLAWREARDACHTYDRIQPRAEARLRAIRSGAAERFAGEARLAEMALREAERADVAYTVISFARRSDRFRYLRGGLDRVVVLRETLERGGVYTQRGHFQGIVR